MWSLCNIAGQLCWVNLLERYVQGMGKSGLAAMATIRQLFQTTSRWGVKRKVRIIASDADPSAVLSEVTLPAALT